MLVNVRACTRHVFFNIFSSSFCMPPRKSHKTANENGIRCQKFKQTFSKRIIKFHLTQECELAIETVFCERHV